MTEDFDVYGTIKTKLLEAISAKTGWGKNELKELITNTLFEVALMELRHEAQNETKKQNHMPLEFR